MIGTHRRSTSRLTTLASLLLVVGACLLALSLGCPSAWAQETDASATQEHEVTVDTKGEAEGYSAVLYDNTNGLPTSEANAIVQTEEGFIWIGSYSGLIRYDGTSFERIDSTQGIASVVSLFVDDQERLWVGTNDSGAAVLERGVFTTYHKSDGLPSSSVRAIAQGADGCIYFATTEGIAYLEGKQIHLVEDPRLADAYIRDLRLGEDGLLWGVTMEDTVFTLEHGVVISCYSAEELGIEGVLVATPDPHAPGQAYLGTKESKIYHGALQPDMASSAELLDVAPLSYIKDIECFGQQVWVCADNGVGFVENGVCTQLENLPMDNSIDHVICDYEGNPWFTSSRQGVMKIVPNQFFDVFDSCDLEPMVVNSTCYHQGQLWIGSDTGLVVIQDKTPLDTLPLRKVRTASGSSIEQDDLIAMLDEHRIRSITEDNEGRLWLATYGEYGLIRYDEGKVTCFTTDDGMPSDRMRTAQPCEDGSVLVACTGGLVHIVGDAIERVYDETSGMANTEVLTVAQGSNGDIITGTDGGGIYVISGETLTHIGSEDGLMSDVVMRVVRDRDEERYWIVTSNSLAYLDADYQATTIHSFPYSNNFDLFENSQGEMWVLSSNGIYVSEVEDLLADDNPSTVYYGANNGLPCIATANSYSGLTPEGDLYIAGSTGVARVNIETPFEADRAIKMGVPFIQADDRMVYPNKKGVFVIDSDVSKITIHGFVFAYSLMDPEVTYHLEGFDESTTTVRRSSLLPVDYTNLPGGTYRFVMQLHNAQGGNEAEIGVEIRKERAYHEQLWFRVLSVLVFMLFVEEAFRIHFRRKTRALERKQEESKTFIREMTEAFAHVIDMKDAYTNGHSIRVAEYTAMLTRELGYDEETVERYYNIALLHDIGKVGIPPEVLNKPGKLTDEEYHIIQSHTTLGHKTLRGISIMPELDVGAWAHHERPDGKGYPRGLKGDEIPRVAQIIGVADCFDAMYSDRPYRNRMNFDRVVSIIKDVRGTQLTADVVDAFLRLVARGEFRDPNDHGGGTTEDIDNIHRRLAKEE